MPKENNASTKFVLGLCIVLIIIIIFINDKLGTDKAVPFLLFFMSMAVCLGIILCVGKCNEKNNKKETPNKPIKLKQYVLIYKKGKRANGKDDFVSVIKKPPENRKNPPEKTEVVSIIF